MREKRCKILHLFSFALQTKDSILHPFSFTNSTLIPFFQILSHLDRRTLAMESALSKTNHVQQQLFYKLDCIEDSIHALELRTSSNLAKTKDSIQTKLSTFDFLNMEQLQAFETRIISRSESAEKSIIKHLSRIEKASQLPKPRPLPLPRSSSQPEQPPPRSQHPAEPETPARRPARGSSSHLGGDQPASLQRSPSQSHSPVIMLRARSKPAPLSIPASPDPARAQPPQPALRSPSPSCTPCPPLSPSSSGQPLRWFPDSGAAGPAGPLVRASSLGSAGGDGPALLARLGPRHVRSRVRALFEERLAGRHGAAGGLAEYLFGLRQPSEAVTGPNDGVRPPATRVIHPASRFNMGPPLPPRFFPPPTSLSLLVRSHLPPALPARRPQRMRPAGR